MKTTSNRPQPRLMSRLMPRRAPRRAPRLRGALLVLALGASGATLACEDPFELRASIPNMSRQFEVWALTGTPLNFPTAVNLLSGSATRVDAQGNFELAFDLDANDRLVVLPVGHVVTPVGGAPTVEFQMATGSYNSVTEAPRDGWVRKDSAFVVEQGDIFLVKITTSACQFDVRQFMHTKFYVDSIVPAERRVKITARINPNCGFRAFTTGIPEF